MQKLICKHKLSLLLHVSNMSTISLLIKWKSLIFLFLNLFWTVKCCRSTSVWFLSWCHKETEFLSVPVLENSCTVLEESPATILRGQACLSGRYPSQHGDQSPAILMVNFNLFKISNFGMTGEAVSWPHTAFTRL